MASRFLGYLTDRHLALYDIRPSGWKLVREFGEEEAAELPDFLHRNQPLHLLADVVEMEFRFDKIPFLRGLDRQALHERKLQQAYRNTSFRNVISLGREAAENGEGKLLLSAITNPDLVSPWLLALRQRRLPLSGIASAPLLLKRLARPLATGNPHILLVTFQRRGGLRITYFFRDEMRFSRMAIHPGDPAELAGITFEEAVRTHQYLLSLRLIERNDPVDVICLLSEATQEAWHSGLSSTETLRFLHLPLPEAARLAGLETEQARHSADDLLIALLIKARFPNHFAPPPERHDFHLHRLRRALLAGSGALALGAALVSGLLLDGTWERNRQVLQAEAQIADLDAAAARMRESLPPTEAPIGEIREALALAKDLEKNSAPTRRLLADLSRGFDAVGEAELERLAWTRTDRPESVTHETRGDAPAVAPDNASRPRRWVAFLTGAIQGAASYRQANTRMEILRDAIQTETIQVDILQYPLNVREDTEMREDFSKAVPERLPFRIRVIWKD